MDRRNKLTFILGEESRNEVARGQLYSMLYFDNHPAETIAENLISLQSRFSIERIVQLLNNSKKDEQWVWDRIQGLMNAERNLYKRSRGCAPGLIDVVAEAACVPPSEIYAPETLYTSQIIDRCMEFVSDRPAGLVDWEAEILEERIKSLSSRDIYIDASTLVKITEGTSLPPYIFMANCEQGKDYKVFRKSVIPIIDEIGIFCLRSQLWDEMCRFVQNKFKRLITFVDNNPGSFVNELYIKFRQQVLDGNTVFINRRLSFRSYLMESFKCLLIDRVRTLTRQQKQQSVAQDVRRQMGLICVEPMEWCSEAEDMPVEKDLILEAILSIPNKAARKILQSNLTDGFFITEGDIGKITRRALLDWSHYMLCKLGIKHRRLPRKLQRQLAWYAESITANFLRDIMKFDQEAHRLGYDRQWLADKLDVTKRSLGKWVRLEVFPREERVKTAKDNIVRLKQILEVSDDTNKLMGKVDYA